MSKQNQAMTSTPKESPKREPLPSRFIEGSELTRPDLLQRNPSLLVNILSEMDAFEKKRKGRAGSNSSVESLSSNGSHPSPIVGKREARRSFGTSRPSLDEKERGGLGEERLRQKVKGRLRAFTSGGREDGRSTMQHGT